MAEGGEGIDKIKFNKYYKQEWALQHLIAVLANDKYDTPQDPQIFLRRAHSRASIIAHNKVVLDMKCKISSSSSSSSSSSFIPIVIENKNTEHNKLNNQDKEYKEYEDDINDIKQEDDEKSMISNIESFTKPRDDKLNIAKDDASNIQENYSEGVIFIADQILKIKQMEPNNENTKLVRSLVEGIWTTLSILQKPRKSY